MVDQAASVPPSGPARGFAVRCSRVLVSPWARFGLLVLLLAAAIVVALALEPQRLLTHGWPLRTSSGLTAVTLFALAYGLATVAFVPRPLLNAAAGALYGIHAGLPAAIGGTVLGAGLAFLLGRFLGRDAVRPLLRGRLVLSLDRQLSRHGFRSTMALRLFPGVPFAAANYAAALSRIRLLPFLTATAAGSAANTAAYVVAGSRAASPTSPIFLLALGFLGVTAVAAAAVARRTRGRDTEADSSPADVGPGSGPVSGIDPVSGTAPGIDPDNGTAPGIGPDNGTAPDIGPDNGTAPGIGPASAPAPNDSSDAGSAPSAVPSAAPDLSAPDRPAIPPAGCA